MSVIQLKNNVKLFNRKIPITVKALLNESKII